MAGQQNLPNDIKKYLLSSEINERNKQIIEKYKFGSEEKKIYFAALLKLFLKEITVFSLPGVLMKSLNIKDDKVLNSLAADIKKIVLSPVAGYFKEEGGKVDFEHKLLVEKAEKKFNLSLDEKSQDRMLELADSLFSEARTKTQFKNALIKSVADGGMGMEKQLAAQVADYFASYVRLNSVIPARVDSESRRAKAETTGKKKEEKILENKKNSVILSDSEGSGDSSPSAQNDTIIAAKPDRPFFAKASKDRPDFNAEEHEAERMKAKVAVLKASAPDVTKKVADAVSEIDLDFPSSEMRDRLKNIVDSRLRSVRTSLQTFEILTQAAEKGGLGLSKDEAEKVSLVFNKYLDAENKDLYKSSVAAKKQWEEKEKAEKIAKDAAEKSKEEQDLNVRFKKMTGKDMPLPAAPSAPVISDARAERAQYSGIQKKNEIPDQVRNDTKKPSKPAFKMPIQAEEAPYFVKAAQGRPSEKNEIPASPKGTPSRGAVMAQRETGMARGSIRPAVEDIKFSGKLYGPLEEIGRMTLEDFRRLSGDPNEVMMKIKDKLSLLREESFKKYQQGVGAWYKSPVYAEYLKVLGQSLEGSEPLDAVLAKSKSLTKEEFNAIISNKIG